VSDRDREGETDRDTLCMCYSTCCHQKRCVCGSQLLQAHESLSSAHIDEMTLKKMMVVVIVMKKTMMLLLRCCCVHDDGGVVLL